MESVNYTAKEAGGSVLSLPALSSQRDFILTHCLYIALLNTHEKDLNSFENS